MGHILRPKESKNEAFKLNRVCYCNENILFTSKTEMSITTQITPTEEGNDNTPYLGASIYDLPSKACKTHALNQMIIAKNPCAYW